MLLHPLNPTRQGHVLNVYLSQRSKCFCNPDPARTVKQPQEASRVPSPSGWVRVVGHPSGSSLPGQEQTQRLQSLPAGASRHTPDKYRCNLLSGDLSSATCFCFYCRIPPVIRFITPFFGSVSSVNGQRSSSNNRKFTTGSKSSRVHDKREGGTGFSHSKCCLLYHFTDYP